MKKFFKVFLLIIMATCCCTIFASCMPQPATQVYVTSVRQNAELSTNETIVIDVKYSDNSTESITIATDAGVEPETAITFADAFDFYCEFNQLEKTNQSLHTFIDEFTNFDVETLTINNIKKNAVCVYSEFEAIYSYSSFITGQQTETCYNVGAGAGVVYKVEDDYTYILTNFHVVFDKDSKSNVTYQGFAHRTFIYQYGTNPQNFIYNTSNKSSCGLYKQEYTFGGRAVQCSYVGGTYLYDLAIIKVPTSSLASWTKATVVAESYGNEDKAYALGNPLSKGFSITEGRVSNVNETIKFSDESFSHRVLRTDAAINGGNSGGGLFNKYGALIGIVSAKKNATDVDNVGYAIPIDIVTKVANNLLANADKKGLQTINLIEPEMIDSYADVDEHSMLKENTVIAITEDIATNSLEYRLGLRKNDVLVEMVIIRNGTETSFAIKRETDVNEILLNLRADDYLYFKVKRDGGNVNLQASRQQISASILDYPKEDEELFSTI